jgi:hypothetical protein
MSGPVGEVREMAGKGGCCIETLLGLGVIKKKKSAK